jgi:hypothetical protein
MIKTLIKWYNKYIVKKDIPKIRLWLDDERGPNNPNTQRLFKAKGNEIWVKTQQEAIEYLEKGNVEYISLDCDLGENGGSGYKVAEWIEEHAYNKTLPPLDWSIHSQNPVESLKAIQALIKADILWNKMR